MKKGFHWKWRQYGTFHRMNVKLFNFSYYSKSILLTKLKIFQSYFSERNRAVRNTINSTPSCQKLPVVVASHKEICLVRYISASMWRSAVSSQKMFIRIICWWYWNPFVLQYKWFERSNAWWECETGVLITCGCWIQKKLNWWFTEAAKCWRSGLILDSHSLAKN